MVTVVFGARGNVGRHVAARLTALDVPVRRTSRTPDASHVPADLEAPESLPAALEGAEQVFLYSKSAGIYAFVEAARSAGVRHVVLLSSAGVVLPGADHQPVGRDHKAVESALDGTSSPPGAAPDGKTGRTSPASTTATACTSSP